jgi:hypothetical protein
MSLPKTLLIACLAFLLAACASAHDNALAAGPADCLVGAEKGPAMSGQPTSARDRRCNPGREAVLWSSERKDGMKLELPRRGE